MTSRRQVDKLVMLMLAQKIIRAVLFVLFFGVGVASLSSSILCEDLAHYYQNKQYLKESQESLNRLRSLNTEYDVLLEKWEQDPNLVVKRVARAKQLAQECGVDPERLELFHIAASQGPLFARCAAEFTDRIRRLHDCC